jgi:ABC-type multidrug transport system fused ATPase/permease subunit
MTYLAKRRRFGRYVFAIGGNPEAAELSGINTRWTLMKVFGLMGLLCGISACISTARLNAATNAAGSLDELYVIASAVIGGTSLAGGVGTIAGAMLGALVMQSLQSGMVLLGRRYAVAEHRGRRRARRGRVARRPVPQAHPVTKGSAMAAGTTTLNAPVTARSTTPLVEMRNISISFGGIKAVDDVTVDLHPGEVVGLLGHNGAGKSTLIKILSGAYRADAGEIYVNGTRVDISSPATPSATASRRSIKRSRSPTTSTPPATSSSAAR